MRKFLQGVWQRIRLGVIIVLSVIIGAVWMYNYQSFAIMKCEAEATWTHVQQIQEQRKEIKIEELKDDVSLAPASDSVQPNDPTGEPKNSPQGSGNEIIDTIYEVAKEKQFEHPEILVKIAKAESSLDPCAKNPNSSATGIFQILDMHNLSKEERCNPRIATAWAIDHFAGGRPWNSSRSKWENM